eukprot:NODE_422_length_8880_cov_0.172759.p7 type:complete len:116 gc:universal NODE_422_length_8880_cov_0.172759:5083-4736(-)
MLFFFLTIFNSLTLDEEYKKWTQTGFYLETDKKMDELNDLKIEKYSETTLSLMTVYLQLTRDKRELIRKYYQILDSNISRPKERFAFYKAAGAFIEEINEFNEESQTHLNFQIVQ